MNLVEETILNPMTNAVFVVQLKLKPIQMNNLTEATTLEGRKSAEEILSEYRRVIDNKILSAMEEYANQFRTQLTDEEIEKEAAKQFPFNGNDLFSIEGQLILSKREGYIASRKMGSSGWVSVEDRLPETNTPVLILKSDTNTVEFAFLDSTGYFNLCYTGTTVLSTHWQPLPSPPKEK